LHRCSEKTLPAESLDERCSKGVSLAQDLKERFDHYLDVEPKSGWITADQVRNELLASRGLVLPTAEGLLLVIMEAMAGDVQALAEAVQARLEASPEILVKIGDVARKQVLLSHDVEKEASKLEWLCTTINQTKAPPLRS
jgi:hypothetical protein